VLGPLPDLLQAVEYLGLGGAEVCVILGHDAVLEVVGQGRAEGGGHLTGAGQDQAPDALAEGGAPRELAHLLVVAVRHLSLLASGRVHVRRAVAPGMGLAGAEVQLAETAALGLPLAFRIGQRRDHEEAGNLSASRTTAP
jgi:hypothetical protein